ncbi:hypothetical protein CRUP_011603 [Coryphaenoides rupestris]|nr:hypothetical protein CRUP_011603 [Coryphaenoides rupestris]
MHGLQPAARRPHQEGCSRRKQGEEFLGAFRPPTLMVLFFVKAPKTTWPPRRLGVLAAAVIYVTGEPEEACTYQQIQVYTVDTDPGHRQPSSRVWAQLGVSQQQAVSAGGADGVTLCYDPDTDAWTADAEIREQRMECGTAVMHGCIYVTGGYTQSKGTYLQSIESYDRGGHLGAARHAALTTCSQRPQSHTAAIRGRNHNLIMADMSPTEIKVARQIEYYFGDHNLPRDKFLKEQLQLDDGWVAVSTMLKFNRLKCLTTDSNVIIEALQKSKTGLLEISEDKTKLRRSSNKPLPEFNEEYKDAMKNKSVYIKGFPLETSLDEILEWLSGKGEAENIQMRRNLERQFKDLLLEEQTGCLLKFSGELDQVSREDFHGLFSGHGKIKWVDFTRGAKEGTLLFDGKAKEALDKATEAHGGTLQLKDDDVTWELLEGDVEKEVLKKMIQAQQESYSRTKGRGREKFGGRGRGSGRSRGRGRGGRDQNRSHFQGKKTKFDSDNEDGPPSPKKRARDDAGTGDAPAAKVVKDENGS